MCNTFSVRTRVSAAHHGSNQKQHASVSSWKKQHFPPEPILFISFRARAHSLIPYSYASDAPSSSPAFATCWCNEHGVTIHISFIRHFRACNSPALCTPPCPQVHFGSIKSVWGRYRPKIVPDGSHPHSRTVQNAMFASVHRIKITTDCGRGVHPFVKSPFDAVDETMKLFLRCCEKEKHRRELRVPRQSSTGSKLFRPSEIVIFYCLMCWYFVKLSLIFFVFHFLTVMDGLLFNTGMQTLTRYGRIGNIGHGSGCKRFRMFNTHWLQFFFWSLRFY